MNPNTGDNPAEGSSSKVLKMKSSSRKAPSRCQGKAEGNKRIRLPYDCARCVFQLCDKLGHRNPSQTIEWLLNEAKSSVNAVLEAIPAPPAATVQACFPTLVPVVPVLTPNQNFNSAPFSQSANGGFDLDQEIAKFLCGSY